MSTTPPRKSTSRGAAAGMLLLSGIVVGALIGLGVGTVVGAVGPLIAVGVLLGFVVGIWAVIVRFRDL